MESPYEVRSSPLHGQGLFGKVDLSPGDLVLAEKPLFTAQPSESISSLLASLSAEHQSAFRSLSSTATATATGDGNGTDKSQDQAIFTANAKPLCRDGNGVEGAHDRLGLFPTIARINHSCSPNVSVVWNESFGSKNHHAKVSSKHDTKGQETVYAIRPIKAGEELLTQYYPVYNTATARKKYAQQRYGFTCACTACTAEHDAASDARRVRIGDLDDEIAWAKNPNPMGAYKFIKERIRLAQEEGLAVPLDTANAHLEAYDIAITKKDYHAAYRHAQLARAYRSIAQGADHPNTLALVAKEHEAKRQLPKTPSKGLPMICDACGGSGSEACEGCKAATYCGGACKEKNAEWHDAVCAAVKRGETMPRRQSVNVRE